MFWGNLDFRDIKCYPYPFLTIFQKSALMQPWALDYKSDPNVWCEKATRYYDQVFKT